jgi:nucleotide-binding universal stress UspA family protein
MKGIQNILVAVDFGDGDQILLDYALQVAQKFNAKLWILHVAAPDPDFVGYEPGPQYIRDFRADDLKQEHKTLHTYAAKIMDAGTSSEALLIQGQTVETILNEAIKLEADLFVVGTHKHGFFYNMVNENPTLELIKKSKIPLLVVPLS